MPPNVTAPNEHTKGSQISNKENVVSFLKMVSYLKTE